MKKVLLWILFAFAMINTASASELTKKCTACHGTKFEKPALGKSAIVAGQSAVDIEKSLTAYKAGSLNKAGMGALMKTQMSTYSASDIKAISKEIGK